MVLKYAEETDRAFVRKLDPHIGEEAFPSQISLCDLERCAAGRIIVLLLLWDHLPFLNLIYLEDHYRGNGLGTQAIHEWESIMKRKGHKMVLLSTQADERAQFLYRRLGYIDCRLSPVPRYPVRSARRNFYAEDFIALAQPLFLILAFYQKWHYNKDLEEREAVVPTLR